jgi:hypothetical protein
MNLNISLEKQYGLMFSGGISSSLLLYFIMKDTPTAKVQPFNHLNSSGATAPYISAIIDYFNSKFNWSIPASIEVGNPQMPLTLQSESAIKQIWDRHAEIDELLIGRTRIMTGQSPIIGTPRFPMLEIGRKVKFPLYSYTKDEILQMVYNEGLEDMLELTHSCVTRPTSRCTHCWNCYNRNLAFAKIGKSDPGTN